MNTQITTFSTTAKTAMERRVELLSEIARLERQLTTDQATIPELRTEAQFEDMRNWSIFRRIERSPRQIVALKKVAKHIAESGLVLKKNIIGDKGRSRPYKYGLAALFRRNSEDDIRKIRLEFRLAGFRQSQIAMTVREISTKDPKNQKPDITRYEMSIAGENLLNVLIAIAIDLPPHLQESESLDRLVDIYASIEYLIYDYKFYIDKVDPEIIYPPKLPTPASDKIWEKRDSLYIEFHKVCQTYTWRENLKDIVEKRAKDKIDTNKFWEAEIKKTRVYVTQKGEIKEGKRKIQPWSLDAINENMEKFKDTLKTTNG